MKLTRGEQIKIGYIDVPKEYMNLDIERRNEICDNLIDVMLTQLDKHLSPEYNRVAFLQEILESSLMTNEYEENFEMCQVILDCTKRLNES